MQGPLKDTQLKILKFLFDAGKPAETETLATLIQRSKSESEYHCDMLREEKLINNVSIPIYSDTFGLDPIHGVEINAKGRKYIMDNIEHDAD
jgi:hypothetical protein